MHLAKRFAFAAVFSGLLTTAAFGQIPDLLTAFDAGGRSMGSGGAFNVSNADTLSSYYNPAGLGYITSRQLGVAYRNLPRSRTVVSGSYSDPEYITTGQSGGSSITHVGFAFPNIGGGTLGVSYTLGGYIDDFATGPTQGLPDGSGSFTITGFQQRQKAKAEFYSVAYGRTNASQNLSWGVGLTFVQQSLEFRQIGNAPITLPNVDDNGNGVGVIAGVQYVPPSSPNTSIALSYRSEIDLNGNDESSGFYDKIPARLMLGASARQDGLRDGRDFLVYGAQIQHFFEGDSSIYFDRQSQTVLGVGLEYSYALQGARVPIRLGYMSIPSGGDLFGSRNTFTYGVGYRPGNGDYTIDLNWGSPQGGGYDFGISASYRFK